MLPPSMSRRRRILQHQPRTRSPPFLLVTTALVPLFLLSVSSLQLVQSSRAAITTPSTGLVNLGNTCYLNSQLQAAYHIPLVRSLVLSKSVLDDGRSDDDLTAATVESSLDDDEEEEEEEETEFDKKEEESVALMALRRVFRDMMRATTAEKGPAVVAPRSFCQDLGIPVFEQQDSQEFWKLLLPAVALPKLTDLYTGSYQTYIVALDGSNRERRRAETFLDLSLDICNDISTSSVQESLQRRFGRPELLCGENQWRPEKGADKVDAHKGTKLVVDGLPSILQLHLKRFQFDWNTETTNKINDCVEFPETLYLDDLIDNSENGGANNKEGLCYKLQAVIVHVGEFGSGHYYAYVRPNLVNGGDDDCCWYRFDDNVVDQVSWDDVIRDAYGGKQRKQATIQRQNNNGNKEKEKQGCILKRLFGGIFGRRSITGSSGDSETYGYGGPKSNAYVLQYVRQCDIPKLYDIVD